MIRGIYCSNTALNAFQRKTEVIANNLSNVNTDGFKQEKLSIKTFKEEINGVLAQDASSDFSAGNLIQTGLSYNFAVGEDAFFKISTDKGFIYSKNGAFSVNEEGYLINNYGNKVVGVNSEVKMVDGKPDQDFYLATFQNKEYLMPTAGGYIAGAQSGEIQTQDNKVLQGFVESSNVDLVQNFADMMCTATSFSLNSRMITSQDEMLKKAVEEVGALK